MKQASLTLIILVALVLSACGGGATQTQTAPKATEAPKAAQPAPAQATQAPAQATSAPAQGQQPAAASGPGYFKKFDVEPNAQITFSGWGDEAEQKVWRDAIARFNKVYPDVKVTYQPVPADFQTKLKAQMAANQAPDTFYVDGELMTAFGATGKLLALDDYLSQAGLQKSDWLESLLPVFTNQGKLYAIPKDFGTLGLVYLPDMFTAAGVKEPTADWTMDDLKNAAKQLTKGRVYGFCMAPDWARFAPSLFQLGGDFTDANFTKATFNSPEAVQAAQYWADMKLKDKSLASPSDVGSGWCGEAIAKQQVAMTWEGGWMIPFLAKDFKDVKYKILPLPKGAKGVSDILFTNGIGVNAATKFPKASAALALYLGSRENQEAILQTGFALPSTKASLDHPWFKDHPNEAALAQMGKVGKLAYWGPNGAKVQDAVSKSLEKVWLGQSEPKAALDSGVDQANKDLAAK